MLKRLLFICTVCLPLSVWAQQSDTVSERVELLPYGDMECWTTRVIKESALLGGATKEVYHIGPTQTIEGACLLYTSPSPRDAHESRMPSSA